ncbi:hypothetical protein Vretifemale_15565, partial [Volvox reticuliferus]
VSSYMYITAYEGCETAQRPFSAKLRLTCKPIPMATFRCTRSLILRAAPALCQLQISSVGTLASTMLPRAQDLPSSSHGTILPPSITSSVKRCFSLDAVQAYLVGLSSSQGPDL